MKVTKIRIIDFHQFKDLEIDLTYPKGHKKEGQPLDKVCFIGQSGTGKTKLLEIIGGLTHNAKQLKNKYSFEFSNGYLLIKNFDLNYQQRLDYLEKEKDKEFFNVFQFKFAGEDVDIEQSNAMDEDSSRIERFNDENSKYIEAVKPNLIYYPADLNYAISEDIDTNDFGERSVIDFSNEYATKIWNLILKDVEKYREFEIKIGYELIASLVKDKTTAAEATEKALLSLEEFKRETINPIEELANQCLNKILKRFRLRVKTELDFKKIDDIRFIKIEDFDGNEIPYGLWSTGTKQIVLSVLPLYRLKPKNTIILVDEPERSLFPDLQRDIVDYYLEFTKDCQLFFATHSPFIAAAFEPEERFILYFDEERNIAVRRGSSPIGDDPNDILRKDFDVYYYNEFGRKAYKRYIDLKREVANETDSQKKKELLIKLAELGDKYNF